MRPTDGQCRDAGTQYPLTEEKRGSRPAPGSGFISSAVFLYYSHRILTCGPRTASRGEMQLRGTAVFHRIRTPCA